MNSLTSGERVSGRLLFGVGADLWTVAFATYAPCEWSTVGTGAYEERLRVGVIAICIKPN